MTFKSRLAREREIAYYEPYSEVSPWMLKKIREIYCKIECPKCELPLDIFRHECAKYQIRKGQMVDVESKDTIVIQCVKNKHRRLDVPVISAVSNGFEGIIFEDIIECHEFSSCGDFHYSIPIESNTLDEHIPIYVSKFLERVG